MKQVKKVVLVFAMSLALSVSAFAASGFEFIASVPIGMQINTPHRFDLKGNNNVSEEVSSDNVVGFNTGLDIQLGYMFQIKENFGISLLGDLGYRFDNFGGKNFKSDKSDKIKIEKTEFAVSTHTFKIGIMPKFNIKAFSIGIGGGILIPMAASHSYAGTKSNNTTKIDKDNPIGFYTKLTFDYSIFLTETSAINVGLYTGFSMVCATKEELPTNPYVQYVQSYIGGFDIGAQIGYRFGPKAF